MNIIEGSTVNIRSVSSRAATFRLRLSWLRGLPLVVSGALVGLADYHQRVEWDAAVERCNSGYLSSPAMVDCWTPEWNQLLAWAQLGHLVLYLLYFAKHVYNDAATTKRHAD